MKIKFNLKKETAWLIGIILSIAFLLAIPVAHMSYFSAFCDRSGDPKNYPGAATRCEYIHFSDVGSSKSLVGMSEDDVRNAYKGKIKFYILEREECSPVMSTHIKRAPFSFLDLTSFEACLNDDGNVVEAKIYINQF